MWNLFRNAEKVRGMVVQRIQEETLRTYLLMFSTVYNTVSLATLCELFELNKQKVYAIIRYVTEVVLGGFSPILGIPEGGNCSPSPGT